MPFVSSVERADHFQETTLDALDEYMMSLEKHKLKVLCTPSRCAIVV